jgi:hypothetical protein
MQTTRNADPDFNPHDAHAAARSPHVVIMDIDGTLANADHRLHLLPTDDSIHQAISEGRLTKSEAWVGFLDAAKDDVPNREIVALNNTMFGTALIFVVTGRDRRDEPMTRRWLEQAGVAYDRLYMRPRDDRRDDTVVKLEILAEIRAEGFEVLFAVEDRKRVTAMWRAAGVRCLQVCDGDY